ncbi:hypothetical protein [Roseisolibacter agri]|uniref:PepSY-associated TM helix n=1 Tax=Roseisolibacter agri TaxID=2014610 RepID=A0AA37V2P9_9BACT|nr:hypothetical protein [Roseisolibacter agri]GLC28165.1 hypothetical protein rosag_46780 [Roseisolibacter agri]
MFGKRAKARVASWHKWLGLVLTVPLLGWMASSAAMMLMTMNAPNGLAGSYTLNPYNSVDVRLDEATVAPDAVLRRAAAEHGLERVYWLRLQSRGPHLWYVVKPTPYAAAMVFDARTGARLDPLSDELLAVTANEALLGSRFQGLEHATEYNRYYAADRVPAVRARVGGAQPATLILSRDEGRTLRRLNAASGQFEWWYRTFHVNQYSDHLALWTTLLYACALGVIALAIFGYQLFWWRRPAVATALAPSRARSAGPFRARNLHRKLGAAVGGVLVVQLVVGIYLWLCLGPLEDPFRGKSSFSTDWRGGFAASQPLADAGTVLRQVAASLPADSAGARPVQAIEWRRLGNQDAWLVMPRKDEPPRVFSAATGRPLAALSPTLAGAIAREEVIGKPDFFYVAVAPQLWMDLNRPVPTYRFRFNDPWHTDVYVAQGTGEVVQRRPYFWRLFDPFLAVHMFAFTGVKPLDAALLALVQLTMLGVLATGWRLQFPGSSRRRTAVAVGAPPTVAAADATARAEPEDVLRGVSA